MAGWIARGRWSRWQGARMIRRRSIPVSGDRLRRGPAFLAKVKGSVEKKRLLASIVVSEGREDCRWQIPCRGQHARWPSVTRSSAAAAPVVAQLVKDRLGYKNHWALADYLQARRARHIASKDRCGGRAYAVGQGRRWSTRSRGMNGVMPAHHPANPASPTAGRSKPVPLADVAKRGKEGARAIFHQPPMASASLRLGRRYLQPLIVGEDYPPYREWPAAVCKDPRASP